MNKRVISIYFRVILVMGCALGIYLNIRMSENLWSMFSFYTVQSNLICLGFFMVIVAIQIKGMNPEGNVYSLVKGVFTMAILVTFLVFHVVLKPRIAEMAPSYNPNSFSDILVHTFTPLMVLLDYALFDSKGRYRWFYPFVWAILPLSYPLYVRVYTALGGVFITETGPQKYPYFFLNVDQLGFAGVAGWIGLIGGGLLGMAFLYWLLDRLWGSFKSESQVRGHRASSQ